MSSLRTVFRAVVMIATGIVIVKGWGLYGPTNEQLKSLTASALEKAARAWNQPSQETALAQPPASDPRILLPQQVTADANAAPLASTESFSEAPPLVPLANSGPNTLSSNGDSIASTHEPLKDDPADAVSDLLSQLQKIGGAEAQVAPWGSSGGLYRCCCRAKLGEESALARHFEAVAAEPAAAVEQVVAKVEAWRTEQQNLLR